jgi:hypothetical protein
MQSSPCPALTRACPSRSSDARASGYAEAVVTVDNHTSKAHTVLQVRCARVRHASCSDAQPLPCPQVRTRDRKGLLYDSLRATKDLKVNVSYGKAREESRGLHTRAQLTAPSQVEVRETGICELDLFVGRTSNQEVERRLCQR